MALAISSLPTPVSPVTRMGSGVGAIASAYWKMARMLLAAVTIAAKASGCSRASVSR